MLRPRLHKLDALHAPLHDVDPVDGEFLVQTVAILFGGRERVVNLLHLVDRLQLLVKSPILASLEHADGMHHVRPVHRISGQPVGNSLQPDKKIRSQFELIFFTLKICFIYFDWIEYYVFVLHFCEFFHYNLKFCKNQKTKKIIILKTWGNVFSWVAVVFWLGGDPLSSFQWYRPEPRSRNLYGGGKGVSSCRIASGAPDPFEGRTLAADRGPCDLLTLASSPRAPLWATRYDPTIRRPRPTFKQVSIN